MGIKHTLKTAMDAGATGVGVYCISCVNSKNFDPDDALKLWGADASFPEIARRSKCTRCKRQASSAAPNWPTIGNRAGAPTDIPLGWENANYDNPHRLPPRSMPTERGE